MKFKSSIDKLLARLSGLGKQQVCAPSPAPREPYDGRTPLLSFGEGHDWTLNDAYMGTQVFGGTGGGKTSGSGASIALSLLEIGAGGLILSAKPDDKDLWLKYSAATGRELTVFGPDSGYYFNPFEWEISRGGLGAGLTSNVAEFFGAISVKSSDKAAANEAYFEDAMKQVIRASVDVIVLAKGTLSLPMIMDAIMSAPQTPEEAESKEWNETSFLAECLREAEAKRTERNGPDLDHRRRFWLREFPRLGDRTRASIVSMFTVNADGLLTGPIRELFGTRLNILPEETHAGKLIFIDLPVEVYSNVGIVAQLIWKYCWQQATARRQPEKDGGCPVFLWCDESQFFCAPNDLRFQATARSKRACTIFLTQNIPTYFERAGKDRTNALMGNLQTKIFHSNGDHVTNSYAADTMARGITNRSNSNFSVGGGMSFGTSEAVDYVVPPAEFQRLRKGGPENGWLVDGYIFQAGRIWPSTGESYLKASFKQPQH